MSHALVSADPVLLLVLLCVGAVTTVVCAVAAAVLTGWLAWRATVGAARLLIRTHRHLHHHYTTGETL